MKRDPSVLPKFPESLQNFLCLQIVSGASGRSKTNLLKPLLEKMQPPLEKRRLMPLKHAAAQIGNAAAFTFCLQQRPCLLPLSQVRFFPSIAHMACPNTHSYL